ncbi:MAG: glycoside hydrolase family 92 protein [Roseiflexaceae bacterium]|nr:glycoside hydrolase family 92 protein [Roseiflexaceae bacterium]
MLPIESVRPFQGTNSQPDFSRGNCLPLVQRPFGFTAWTPQTDDGRWIYTWAPAKIQGVRATHSPSPWIGDYGHFTLMPQTGPRIASAEARASFYRHEETVARPDYLRLDLRRYRITVELTATTHCAVLRFTLPAADQARLLVHVPEGDGEFVAEGAILTGLTRANHGGCSDNFACYFAITFDAPFQDVAVEPLGTGSVASVEFGAGAARVITARVATSFISVAQAQQNLQGEVEGRRFDDVRAESAAVWNELLGRVEIAGASKRERETFYTCLWRSLLFPRLLTETDTVGNRVHYSPYDGAVHPGVLSTDNGFWDTYRTVYPLLSLVYPDLLGELLEGWVQAAREGGWLPTWASPGYRACMIGTHLDAIFADALVKHIVGWDVEAAYNAVRRDALEAGDQAGNWGRKAMPAYWQHGYVPLEAADHAASRTLEYAYTDWCVAQMAQALGREEDATTLFARATNYRHTFDTTIGFVRGRSSDGRWQEPFNPVTWGTDVYIEGGAWQSNWQVPHDPAGLIALLGGPHACVAKLDEMLDTPANFNTGGYGSEIHEMSEMAAANFGQYAHSNQPVHGALFFYTCAGQPWKTQYWTRRVLAELYGPDENGLPGDEDNGEMSAWYVLCALGLYQLCPGQPEYVLTSPLFARATIHLSNGNDLTILSRNAHSEHVYIQNVEHNGESYTRTVIDYADLLRGGVLQFELGSTPRHRVPTDAELPFSFSTNRGHTTRRYP